MSLESWLDEFYPVSADMADDPLEHSLRKWKGTEAANLAKHRVELAKQCVQEPKSNLYFSFGGSNCALCHLHYIGKIDPCDTCPLTLLKKKKIPNWTYEDAGCEAEWEQFVFNRNPFPMIQLLEEAAKDVD